jgi:hypothetical protein
MPIRRQKEVRSDYRLMYAVIEGETADREHEALLEFIENFTSKDGLFADDDPGYVVKEVEKFLRGKKRLLLVLLERRRYKNLTVLGAILFFGFVQRIPITDRQYSSSPDKTEAYVTQALERQAKEIAHFELLARRKRERERLMGKTKPKSRRTRGPAR